MSVLAFCGSPRPNGNSSLLLAEFVKGLKAGGGDVEIIFPEKINIKYCRGCLRCNILKHCAIRSDDWDELSQKILKAKSLVFAAPVYFHHLPAPLKAIIDRFRSFQHVRILEDGLKHTSWQKWKKHFVLLMSLGNPSTEDTKPIVDLFQFICDELGTENSLTTIIGTRLAVTKQVTMQKDQLTSLYRKLNIPAHLVELDYERNQQLLKQCFELGNKLASY